MLILRQFIRLLDRLDRKIHVLKQRNNKSFHNVGVLNLSGDTLDFARPYFVLSTGRCGTLWLSELLSLSSGIHVNHSDHPELIRHSRLAYEHYEQKPELFQELIHATRDEWIFQAYKREQVYVETNNRITFFAYAIKHIYPHARFIHLVRHPGDFVRSGISRGWYRTQNRHELGRIVMSEDLQLWKVMSDIEKIAWLWNETNQYIQDFLAALPKEKYIQVKAEDMFGVPSASSDMIHFIGCEDISIKFISKMLKHRINRQKIWKIDEYHSWTAEQKAQVRHWAKLANFYGYHL